MTSSLLRRVETLEAWAPARRMVFLIPGVRGRDEAATLAHEFPNGAPADVDLVWILYRPQIKWGTAASDGVY